MDSEGKSVASNKKSFLMLFFMCGVTMMIPSFIGQYIGDDAVNRLLIYWGGMVYMYYIKS